MSSLRFAGSVTIQSAAEARARFTEAFAAGGDVLVDCSAVDEADITFLQVLIAAQRSATARGVSLRLVPKPSARMFAVLDRAGVALPPGMMPE